MKKLLAAVLIAIAGSAFADELTLDTLSLHTKTVHEEPSGSGTALVRYNNLNPGIGYKTSSGWMFGTYRNSYFKPTYYVGKELMYTEWFGVVLGLGTGYQLATGHAISPIAALEYKIPVADRWSLDLLASPPIGKNAGIAHAMLSYRF